MSLTVPPVDAARLVVPLRDVLFVVAILVIVVIACNLCLLVYLSTQSSLADPPSLGGRECVWEKGPGDEGPGEAGSWSSGSWKPAQ